MKLLVLAVIFIYLVTLPGNSEFYEEPEREPEREPEEDPVEIVSRALRCFDDRVVYRRCDHEYRLSAEGEFSVPEDSTEAFCSGPCMEETDLVLHCIDRILDHFEFYNRATIRDVRETIRDACGWGSWRGRFDVSEHIRANDAVKLVHPQSHLLTLTVGFSLMALLIYR